MKELEKHKAAFEEYYATRNMLAMSRTLQVSRQSLGKWKVEFNWDARCKERDSEVNAQVQAVMTPQWAAVKIILAQTFLNQLNAAIKLGISPENSRDMVAVSRELRALLGEGEKVEVEFTGIEYKLVETKEEV